MSKRGNLLETFIEASNRQYKLKKVAVIDKIATPTQVRRSGPDRAITGAYYEAKSTVDFIGISKGKFIAFDAKQTKGKNLPFNNIHDHQIKYLQSIKEQGGIAFFIVLFSDINKMYRIELDELLMLKETLDRKSIPLAWFEENKEQIVSRNGVAYDYL